MRNNEITISEAQKELGFNQSVAASVYADSNEWYTPQAYIDAARKVLGRFDLDPASCALANKVVKAKTFFSRNEDGLSKKWKGTVWMNPPYGDAGPKFVAKLIAAYKAGHVTEAIVLANSHCTDARWFQPLFDYVLCFTNHRSKFWNKEGVGNGSTHGSVFAYLGADPEKFTTEFKEFGAVVCRASERFTCQTCTQAA